MSSRGGARNAVPSVATDARGAPEGAYRPCSTGRSRCSRRRHPVVKRRGAARARPRRRRPSHRSPGGSVRPPSSGAQDSAGAEVAPPCARAAEIGGPEPSASPASHLMIHAARLDDHGRRALTSHKFRMRLEDASGVPGDSADLRKSRALPSHAGVRTGVVDLLLRSKILPARRSPQERLLLPAVRARPSRTNGVGLPTGRRSSRRSGKALPRQ